jgi:hypothetical protein
MLKVALCLRGAISKKQTAFTLEGSLYSDPAEYIDFRAVYKSIEKHIIKVNEEKYSFDTFIHCWNTDLQDELVELYSPKKYTFENNEIYNEEIRQKIVNNEDFSGISQALTMRKSIELMQEYERENDFKYHLIILYRPDVILWKDMVLDHYSPDLIYVNNFSGYGVNNGDFHFVMNSDTSNEFKDLYLSAGNGNPHRVHHWIQNYIVQFMHKQLQMDDICAGGDQELLRKLRSCSISPGRVDFETLKEYGLTENNIP